MKRKKVKSSNIASIGYDSKVLEVQFNNDTIYHYRGVDKKVYEALMKADSVGKYFNKNIKTAYKYGKGEFKTIKYPNIYICGKAGAGKTYAAKYLIKMLGYIQAKFAFPVYGLAYDYFQMDKKDRLLLQMIGTEAARESVDEDIWVDRFMEDTKIVQLTREKLSLTPVGLVCDDCRFENEHIKLKENGWIGLYLDVSDEVRIQRLGKRDGNAQKATLQHSSETAIDNFKDDLIQIDSSGTLEQTYKQLDDIIEKLGA